MGTEPSHLGPQDEKRLSRAERLSRRGSSGSRETFQLTAALKEKADEERRKEEAYEELQVMEGQSSMKTRHLKQGDDYWNELRNDPSFVPQARYRIHKMLTNSKFDMVIGILTASAGVGRWDDIRILFLPKFSTNVEERSSVV